MAKNIVLLSTTNIGFDTNFFDSFAKGVEESLQALAESFADPRTSMISILEIVSFIHILRSAVNIFSVFKKWDKASEEGRELKLTQSEKLSLGMDIAAIIFEAGVTVLYHFRSEAYDLSDILSPELIKLFDEVPAGEIADIFIVSAIAVLIVSIASSVILYISTQAEIKQLKTSFVSYLNDASEYRNVNNFSYNDFKSLIRLSPNVFDDPEFDYNKIELIKYIIFNIQPELINKKLLLGLIEENKDAFIKTVIDEEWFNIARFAYLVGEYPEIIAGKEAEIIQHEESPSLFLKESFRSMVFENEALFSALRDLDAAAFKGIMEYKAPEVNWRQNQSSVLYEFLAQQNLDSGQKAQLLEKVKESLTQEEIWSILMKDKGYHRIADRMIIEDLNKIMEDPLHRAILLIKMGSSEMSKKKTTYDIDEYDNSITQTRETVEFRENEFIEAIQELQYEDLDGLSEKNRKTIYTSAIAVIGRLLNSDNPNASILKEILKFAELGGDLDVDYFTNNHFSVRDIIQDISEKEDKNPEVEGLINQFAEAGFIKDTSGYGADFSDDEDLDFVIQIEDSFIGNLPTAVDGEDEISGYTSFTAIAGGNRENIGDMWIENEVMATILDMCVRYNESHTHTRG